MAAGDESAVAECVDEYAGLVWRLARRYLDSAGSEVEDATQEVFFELWLNAGRFDPARASEPAFVATIAHRRLIDHQRRVTSRRRVAQSIEPKPESPARLRDMLQREEFARVAEAFDRLPDDERRALWLSIYAGMSHRQIGVATDSPIGTVKTRLRRGLLRLNDALSPGADGEAGS